MKKINKFLLSFFLFVCLFILNSASSQKINATTDFFGEIDDVWMLGNWSEKGTIIKTEDGTLYASGRNYNGMLGLGDNSNRYMTFTKVKFHNTFYGTGKEIIQASYISDSIGLLLDNQGNIYYSTTRTGDYRGNTNAARIFAEGSTGANFTADIDNDRAEGTTLAGRSKRATRGEFVIHQALADWSKDNDLKIIDMQGLMGGIVFETEDHSLWGIGGGGQNNDYHNNIFALGTTVSTDDGSGNYVKKLADNVEDWSAERANEREYNTEVGTLFFKVNGEWFVTGSSNSARTLTGLNKDYLTVEDYNNPNTVAGNPGIGTKIDLSIINNKFGTSYTFDDLKQVQAGYVKTEFLFDDGIMYSIGRGIWGSMTNDGNTSSGDGQYTSPVKNLVIASESYQAEVGEGWDKIVEVYKSVENTWVRMESGRVWARGDNSDGDLGFRTEPYTNPEPKLTDITDSGRTGRMVPAQVSGGITRQSSSRVWNPKKMQIAFNGAVMLDSQGYILGTGPANEGYYGSTIFETNYGNWGFSRVKREHRVVRNPEIVVDGDNQAVSWKINPESIKIGKATEWLNKEEGTYPTYGEYTIYGCAADYTSKDETECTYEVANNKIAGTSYSSAHDVNRIDDEDLMDINLNSLDLEPGYYKIVAKRYAFIGPNGTGLSGVNTGTLQYNEEGTDDQYFVEFKIDPEITNPEYKEVNINEIYDPETGVTAKNSKGKAVNFGVGEYDLKYTSNVDTTKVGVYTVTYTMKDQYDPDITTTKTTKVLVKDKNTIIDKEKGYMIDAKDYQLMQGTDIILGTATEILDKSKAQGWKLANGESAAVTVSDNGGYKNQVGGYKFEVVITEENTVKANAVASIVDEDTIIVGDYALSAKNFFILKKDIKGTADITDTEYGAAKAWNLTDLDAPATINVASNGGYTSSANEGKYTIQINVKENAATAKTITARVFDKDKITVGNEYVIVSNDIIIGKDKAKEIISDDNLIEATKAKAYKKSDDSEATVKVDAANTNFASAAGDYKATFYVDAESSTKVESKIKVLDYDVVITGDTYSIGANNITVGKENVKELIENDNKIIQLTFAKAWKNSDTSTEGTIKVVNKSNLKAEEGNYKIVLGTNEDSTAYGEVMVKVIDKDIVESSEHYSIAANHITVGKEDVAKLLADDDKLITTTRAEVWKKTDYSNKGTVKVKDKSKLTSTIGTYEVSFVAQEDANAYLTIKVSVIDKDKVANGNQYNIGANNVTIELDNAKAITSDEALINLVNAEGWKRNNIEESVDIEVVNPEDYEAEIGNYLISFAVKDDLTTQVTVEITVIDNIIIPIDYILEADNFEISLKDANALNDEKILKLANAVAYDKDNIDTIIDVTVKDKTDYKPEPGTYNVVLLADDGIHTPVEKTIKIRVLDKGEVVLNKQYAIGANNTVISKEEAASVKAEADLISFAQAEAWEKGKYESKHDVIVKSSEFKSDVGKYLITFAVKEDPTTSVNINITVVDRTIIEQTNEYVIAVNNPIIGKIDAQAIEDDQDLIDLTQAIAWEKDTEEIKEVIVTDNYFTVAPGTYQVVFAIKDNPVTNATSEITVLDDDYANNGNKYLLSGNDFTINTTVAKTITESDIIEKAQAKSVLNTTKVNNGTIKVKENILLNQDIGEYFVELYVNEEPTTKITIKVNISNGEAPELNVTTPIVIGVGETFDKKAGVSISDDKDSLTIDDIDITGSYDVNKEGLYVIKYSITDSDYNYVEKTRVLIVNDGGFVIGTDYSLYAENYDINIKDVIESDSEIIKNAKAKAFNNQDGSSVNVIVTNKDGYSINEGMYNIEFSVEDEVTTTKTIKANVIDEYEILLNSPSKSVKVGADKIDYKALFEVSLKDGLGNALSNDLLELDNSKEKLNETGNYTVTFKVKNKSDMEFTKNATINVTPVKLSGTIFEDTNYDSKNNDSKTLSEIILYLVDEDSNEVIDVTESDTKGKYSFDLPAGKEVKDFSGKYSITVQEPSGYTLAMQNVISGNPVLCSAFEPASKTINGFSINGIDYNNINAGLARNVDASLSSTTVSVYVGDKVAVNIGAKNGSYKIRQLTKGNTKYITKPNGIEIMGIKAGSNKYAIEYINKYNGVSTIKTIDVTVKALPFNTTTTSSAVFKKESENLFATESRSNQLMSETDVSVKTVTLIGAIGSLLSPLVFMRYLLVK